MKTLEKNIKNAFGHNGSQWLIDLPLIIQKLAKLWSLTDIQPVTNMSWNYVAYVVSNTDKQLVLKISCEKKLIQDEYRALKHFDGHGAINVIDVHEEYHAMLLARAIPGALLKDNYTFNINDVIKNYGQVIKAIASRSLQDASYTHMRDWCDAIDKIEDTRININFLVKAKQVREVLLNTVKNEYLCHGDLHLENIIQDGSNWLAIDPKGIIGEMAFEAAAFDLLSKNEMSDPATISKKVMDRVFTLASELNISFDRLLSWVYLRIIISAQWFIEDKGDPTQMLKLANHVYPLVMIDKIKSEK